MPMLWAKPILKTTKSEENRMFLVPPKCRNLFNGKCGNLLFQSAEWRLSLSRSYNALGKSFRRFFVARISLTIGIHDATFSYVVPIESSLDYEGGCWPCFRGRLLISLADAFILHDQLTEIVIVTKWPEVYCRIVLAPHDLFYIVLNPSRSRLHYSNNKHHIRFRRMMGFIVYLPILSPDIINTRLVIASSILLPINVTIT